MGSFQGFWRGSFEGVCRVPSRAHLGSGDFGKEASRAREYRDRIDST